MRFLALQFANLVCKSWFHSEPFAGEKVGQWGGVLQEVVEVRIWHFFPQGNWYRDANSGRYICAILSKAVLIFEPCTNRNRSCEHCAVCAGNTVVIILTPRIHDSRLTHYPTANTLSNGLLLIVFLRVSCGLSATRAQRTKSRGPDGLQLCISQ